MQKDEKLFEIINFQKSGHPTVNFTDIFERVERKWNIKRPLKRKSPITLHLHLTHNKKPVINATIQLFDANGNSLQWHGTRFTTEDGQAMICIDNGVARNLSGIRVDVKLANGTCLSFNNLKTGTTVAKSYQAQKGFVLEVPVPSSYPVLAEKKKRRLRKPIGLAISGTADHLSKTIPFIHSHDCFYLSTIFLKGKADISLPILRRKPVVYPFNHKLLELLKGNDVLIDCTDSPLVQKLWTKQMMGEVKTETIIVSFARFLKHLNKLQYKFMTNNEINRKADKDVVE